MKTCKYANLQECKFASMQMCKYADVQVCQPMQSLNVCQFFSVSMQLMVIDLVSFLVNALLLILILFGQPFTLSHIVGIFFSPPSQSPQATELQSGPETLNQGQGPSIRVRDPQPGPETSIRVRDPQSGSGTLNQGQNTSVIFKTTHKLTVL